MMRQQKKIKIGRYLIAISSPDRVIFPKDKITKAELIAYYVDHAEYMLPYMKSHLLTMQRFPEGIDHEGFYQKNAAEYFPAWIKTFPVEHEQRTVNYVVCNNAATLAYLANQACITPHLWLSAVSDVHIPDRMIFDLDPAGNDFACVRHAALLLRSLLEKELGLKTFVMTTGSKGLHVWVALKKKYNFAWVHEFAHDCARLLVARAPKQLTIEIRKEKRGQKVFIDFLRNSYSATAVAPYAVRAKHGAPIATPLHWHEVEDATLTSQVYTLKNIDARLSKIDNPWQAMKTFRCSLTKARRMLDILIKEL